MLFDRFPLFCVNRSGLAAGQHRVHASHSPLLRRNPRAPTGRNRSAHALLIYLLERAVWSVSFFGFLLQRLFSAVTYCHRNASCMLWSLVIQASCASYRLASCHQPTGRSTCLPFASSPTAPAASCAARPLGQQRTWPVFWRRIV